MILCGTDLSPASADAIAVARALAGLRNEPELLVVHVVTGSSDGVDDEAIARARNALDAQVAAQLAARPGAPAIRAMAIVGPPDETLIDIAERDHADLIVIAARSTGGSLLRLGTTAEQVIAKTHVPVLLIRESEHWLAFARGARPLRVMVGIDESAACDLGIQWVQGLRAQRAAGVDVVLGAIYYSDETAERYGLHPGAVVDRDPEIERLMARDLERRFGDHAAGRGAIIARPRRGLGRIGDHLVELARDEQVDVIVVGTSQKTGLGRLGSVSSIVVHDAPQSVVCVPPNAAVETTAIPTLRCALVATDLSPFGNRAVPYAFAITPPTGEVHVAHVVKSDTAVDVAAETRALSALVPTGAPHAVVPHIIRGDDPAQAIAQLAARLGADVICLASHGRKGLTRALVGSVADRLLRATRVPVLVLRPPS